MDKAFLDKHEVTMNRRYVFFKSLKTTAQKLPIYRKYYTYGMELKNEATNALKPNLQESSQQDLDKIKQYINYIGDLANKEKNNEIIFINQFMNILNDLENCDFKDEMIKFAHSIQEGHVSNYTQYLSLINTMMTKNEAFARKRQEVAVESMKFINQSYNNAEKTLQQEILQALHEGDYNKYQTKIRSTYPKIPSAGYPEFNGAISNKFGSKFTSILNQVADDQKLMDDLGEAWKNKGLTQNQAAMYIAATVSKYLENLSFDELDKNTVATIMRSLKDDSTQLTNLMKDLSEEYVENIWNLLSRKKIVDKTLEEIALTTRRGLGDLFLRMDQSGQTDIFNLYSQYGFDQKTFNSIIHNANLSSKKQAALITEKLGKAIRNFFRQTGWLTTPLIDKYSKERREAIEQELKKSINFQNFKNQHQRKLNPAYIKNQLQVTMTGPASAEEMAAEIVENLNDKDIAALLGGNVIKSKTDIHITFTGNIDFEDEINTTVSESIINATSKFNENFIKNVHNEIGDKVDTQMKRVVYHQEIQNLHDNIIKELEKFYSGNELNQKIDLVLKKLNDLITGGIQVKDYVHGGTLGFMGESLGANGDQILKNINDMYDTGGISRIDYSILYFTLANCGEDALASDLKDDLAKYLLGGAMMILFDEGFTASEKFLDSIKKQFNFAPSTIHLFNLQGGHFIPASFIYNTVYDNLITAYGEIASEIDERLEMKNITNEITIINNIIESNKPHYTDMPMAQDRWNAVRELVNTKNNVDIKITFLAGMLDIFEALPKAFNI